MDPKLGLTILRNIYSDVGCVSSTVSNVPKLLNIHIVYSLNQISQMYDTTKLKCSFKLKEQTPAGFYLHLLQLLLSLLLHLQHLPDPEQRT